MAALDRETLLAGIRESFGRIVYSHKTHEKTIEILNGQVICLKIAEVSLLVFTTGGLLRAILADDRLFQSLTAISAALALGISVYNLSFNPTEQILKHRAAARKLWHIREKYINLIADIKAGGVSDDRIQQRRDELADWLAEVYADAPDTSSKAYEKARDALKINEEMTFSKKEIDQFLPSELR